MASKRRSSPQPEPVGPPEHLAGPPPKPKRCAAKTGKGKGARCKRMALPDAKFCAQHLGPTSRPTKLDDEVIKKVLEVLAFGGYVETAAAVAGVSKQTFYNWIERGDPDGTKKEDEPYRAFRERVEHARAEGEAANVELVRKAATRDWRAAAWMLERQYPQRWGGPLARRDAGFGGGPEDPGAGVDPLDGPSVADDQVDRDGRPL